MNRMSKYLIVIAVLVAIAVLAIVPAVAQDDEEAEFNMATIVKLTGVGWFDRMEEGVAMFSEDHENVNAFQQGPSEADAALQVQVIEDLLAQGVDSLCVIPFQPESVEPVLQRAREEGVVVITHEASNQINIDYDIEAFDNAAYGRHLMDHLAERMGEEGEYVVFVGSLTSRTHNEWVDAAIEHQLENYPNMTLVGDKNESYDNAETAYERMQELLITYPDLKGMQGSSANDVIGAGQAVEEAGLQDDIAVVGTSLPSMAGGLLETGAVDLISFWDPALAGYACNSLALMLLEGETPEAGMDLGLEGYSEITLPNELVDSEGNQVVDCPEGEECEEVDGNVFYGAAWVDVTVDNMDEWDF
jgi:simple sugar transport system substrate-binding protein